MRGPEDRARFNTVLVWLSMRMKAQGGLPIKLSPELQDDYYQALNNLPIERLEWAARHLFSTKTWFPMPCEIREAAIQAPANVIPRVILEQKALPEASYYEDGSKKLQSIIDSLVCR
jgi:hypothetical protein